MSRLSHLKLSWLVGTVLWAGLPMAPILAQPPEPTYELERTVRSRHWEEVSLTGTDFEGFDNDAEPTGQLLSAVHAELLLLRGARGIEEAHLAGALPTWARDELLAEQIELVGEILPSGRCRQDDRQVYAVSREALALISGELAFAADGPANTQRGLGLPFCRDLTKRFMKTPQVDAAFGSTQPLEGQGFRGELDFHFDLEINPRAVPWELELKIKRFLCIPYAVRLRRAVFDLEAQAGLRVTGRGQFDGLTAQANLRDEIDGPRVATLAFSVGPVPVVIPFDLAFALGLEVTANAAGEVGFSGTSEVGFQRAYECDGDGCEQTANRAEADFHREGELRFNAGRGVAYLFGEAALRAALYAPDVASVRLGVRSGLRAEGVFQPPALGCGDADGDGQEDRVELRLLDFDGRLDLIARVNVWKLDADFSATVVRRHADFVELPLAVGSASAITPLLRGPEAFQPGDAVTFQAAMRPCWPWRDVVPFTFDLPEASCPEPLEVTGANAHDLTAPLVCSYPSGGVKRFGVNPGQDHHGRHLGPHPTTRSALGNVVPLGFLDGAVDPRDGDTFVPLGGRVAVSGWAFDPDGNPGAPVAGVSLVRQDGSALTVLPASSATVRPDVAAHLGRPDAFWSGFAGEVPLYAEPLQPLRLWGRARDGEGGEQNLGTPKRVTVIANDKVSTPGEITERDAGQVYRGNTGLRGTVGGYEDDHATDCGGAGANDAVYRLTLAAPARVLLTTVGSGFDTVLSLGWLEFDAGSASLHLVPFACDDNGAAGGGSSELVADLPAGVVFVVVDGRGPDDQGPFQLQFSTLP